MDAASSARSSPVNFNAAPFFVPKAVANKLYNLFANAMKEQTSPEGATKPPILQRSILLQKGSGAKAVKLFAKQVLGKKLYQQRVTELRAECVTALANTMKTRELTADDVKETSSTEVAKAHLEASPPGTKVEPLKSTDGKEWVALRYNRTSKQIERDKVTTTSERSFQELEKQDLTNIYVKISDDGHISITCGVIDTTAKADAFIAAVNWAQEKQKELPLSHIPPLRLSMHQLNSMGVGPGVLVAEKDLVTSQHEMALYINSKLSPDGSPVVSHTNRCLNGFTLIRGEDAKSHGINQEGLALQMQWVFDDVQRQVKDTHKYVDYEEAQKAVTDTSTKLQQKREELRLTKEKHPELKQKLDEIEREMHALVIKGELGLGIQDHADAENYEKLKTRASTLESQISDIESLEKDIGTLEKTLEKQNKELCREMHNLSKSLPKGHSAKATLRLAVRVLASQTDMNKTLGLPQLSSTQELACMLLLDEALHATTEINCKSGLDRTGFTRALQTAIQMKMKKDDNLDTTLTFLLNFEKNVKRNDANDLKFEARTKVEIEEFQNNIMTEIQNVALEITKRSTGIRGMKWNWAKGLFFQRNPHPIKYLPLKDENGKDLFTLDKNGNRQITTKATELLCGLSSKRGG